LSGKGRKRGIFAVKREAVGKRGSGSKGAQGRRKNRTKEKRKEIMCTGYNLSRKKKFHKLRDCSVQKGLLLTRALGTLGGGTDV